MLDSIINSLVTDQVAKIAEKYGMDPATAKSVAGAALPMIMKAIHSNTSTQEWADKLLKAASDHAETPVDQLDTNDGMKILSHFLGDNTDIAAADIANKAWIDADQTKGIMWDLSSLIMQGVNKSAQSGEITTENVSKQAEATNNMFDKDGMMMQMATKMLDSNNDWNITDDLLKKWMDMFFWDKK